ncbi:hypothetical protein PV05_10590 [Exophiala xenobiotica]|uniref:peptidyl-tRNA hydrolase n=1 Tax=Exophiala xenobiotica TaxID=348802 RepID=A0A0D2EB67_9EURO|nr:uncharacterized protein PV05_10590 [Exophiala xenobiotica]KIW51915.1 hypothetical protein PV05_10590 [Exophiala xenobiotica]
MANSNPARSHQRRRSEAQTQNSYVQYHDPEKGISWAEPVEQDLSILLNPIPVVDSQFPRKQHVKRRPVNPIISTTPPTTERSDGPLSPIIPSPLRIRKPRPFAPAMPPSPARQVRLLIASIGNPPPYHTTRHSAGHLLLKTLAAHMNFPPLSRSKVLGSGSASLGSDRGSPEYTLWQSASLMNVSGAGTIKAWKQFNTLHSASPDSDVVTALVILHDELESSIGTIKLRRGETSPKGHNGIKSIQSSLKSASMLPSMGDRFIKIGIGIGRPQSREKDDVSAWVLGQATHVERTKIEAAADSVMAVLKSEIARLERT